MTEEELYAGAGEVTRKCLDDILESEYGFVQDDEDLHIGVPADLSVQNICRGLDGYAFAAWIFRTGRRCQRKDCLCPGML